MHGIVYIAYSCELIWMCVEFRDEILLKGEECKTRENSIFLRKGKTVISMRKFEIFYRSPMMKQTSPLELSHEI